jgi:hypothetical protein
MSMTHPKRFRANDLHPDVANSLSDRFWRYCHKRLPEQCWLWAGTRDAYGYGRLTVKPTTLLAHRVSWVLASQRPLTNDLTIDHLCRNKRCVNPAHLEAVSVDENFRRSLVPRFGPARTKRLSAPIQYDVPPGQPHRRICPICQADYDHGYVAAHIRRVHPEAA